MSDCLPKPFLITAELSRIDGGFTRHVVKPMELRELRTCRVFRIHIPDRLLIIIASHRHGDVASLELAIVPYRVSSGAEWKLAKECVDVNVCCILELVGCGVIDAAAVLSRSERRLFLSSWVLFQSG